MSRLIEIVEDKRMKFGKWVACFNTINCYFMKQFEECHYHGENEPFQDQAVMWYHIVLLNILFHDIWDSLFFGCCVTASS